MGEGEEMCFGEYDGDDGDVEDLEAVECDFQAQQRYLQKYRAMLLSAPRKAHPLRGALVPPPGGLL